MKTSVKGERGSGETSNFPATTTVHQKKAGGVVSESPIP